MSNNDTISFIADVDDNGVGRSRLEGGWEQSQIGRSLILGRLLLLLLDLVHYETFQNHETVNSLHLPCPAWSFTASLLSNELHEHWAVYVVGVGARVVERETVTSPRRPAPHNR